jgi:5-aminopentanamidase
VARSSPGALRIALLHLAPLPGQIAHNRKLIEMSVRMAADAGADWIITPELAVCGYTFAEDAGTDWIETQPDAWMTGLCAFAAERRVTIFLSTPERDAVTQKLHNAVFVIAEDGRIAGSHRKINTLRIGSEAWSTPGDASGPIDIPPYHRVGLLICADAYSPPIAAQLEEAGANLLISVAAWAPGLHGPNGEWERATHDTGLPLIVCNRTGRDLTMDFSASISTIIQNGERVLSLSSDDSRIFIIDWDTRTQTLASKQYREISIGNAG